MLKRLFGLDFSKAIERLPRWFGDEAEGYKWQMPDPSIYGNQAELYRKLSYIGTVVDVVTQACISADFDVVDAEGVENDSHPLVKLIDNPNGYDSRTEFLRAHYAWRVITGNAYWWLNRTSENEMPDEVWILPPSKIIPVPDKVLGLKGYVYYPGNGVEIALEPYEVIHFKGFNPFNRYLGMSAIESLAMTAHGALKAQEWNTRLFAENNARLPGIIAFKQMINDSDWDRIKRDMTNAAAKRNHMMLRGVGDNVNWIQSAATQKEMEFLAGLDRSMREIYDRLAPGLYNMLTANASLANGETGAFTFQKFTVQPLLREMADKLNAELMPAYGEGWTATFEDVLPEDKAMKMAEIEQFAKFHTVDEVRVEMFGNDPDPDPERGKLFVAQVGASSLPAEPPQVVETVEDVPDVEDTPEEVDDMEELDFETVNELGQFERKALKYIQRDFDFTCVYVPEEMQKKIREGLKSAKSSRDVKAVFASVKPKVKHTATDEAVLALAQSIENAVKGLQSAK